MSMEPAPKPVCGSLDMEKKKEPLSNQTNKGKKSGKIWPRAKKIEKKNRRRSSRRQLCVISDDKESESTGLVNG